MKLLLAISLTSLLVAFSSNAYCTDFYVAPGAGSDSNDGSKTKPWASLQAVIDSGLVESQNWASLPYSQGKKLVKRNPGAPVKAGDTIWLRNGYHGSLAIIGYYNQKAITIASMPGESPRFSSVRLRAGTNWVLRGLLVSPDFAPTYSPTQMISVESDEYAGPVSDIVVEKCMLRSKLNVANWSKKDWDTLAANGISASGERITIRENEISNVNFGISLNANNSLVDRNTVDSFCGDGLRGLGDHTTFQYNLVQNGYQVNENHMDGFQSWSIGTNGAPGTGEVVDVVLRGNVFINYRDPNQPFRGDMQGIGCFDGTYTNWLVENNVIMTNHFHGITFVGAKNVRIINNTVVDLNSASPGPPWISIVAHKNGTAPVGCLVRNNLTSALNLSPIGVSEDHNLVVKDMNSIFVAPSKWDLHLKANGAAIDVGNSEKAPTLDAEGTGRPQGKGVDLGAYEWHHAVAEQDAASGDSADSSTADREVDDGNAATETSDSGCHLGAVGRGKAPSLLILSLLFAFRFRCKTAVSKSAGRIYPKAHSVF